MIINVYVGYGNEGNFAVAFCKKYREKHGVSYDFERLGTQTGWVCIYTTALVVAAGRRSSKAVKEFTAVDGTFVEGFMEVA